MAREVELKLVIDPNHAARLRGLGVREDDDAQQRQVSVYFDTPKQKLRRQGWVLRVRQANGGFIQTIKRSSNGAGLFDRGEWESKVGELKPDPKAVAKTPLADVIGPRQLRHLDAICRSDVDRSTRILERNGGTIEMSVDEGLIEARECSEAVHEIELELKGGEVGSLFATARTLVVRAPLKLGVMSKSESGFALADAKGTKPAKSTPVTLTEEMSVAESFATIVDGCLKHLRMNEPLLIAGQDIEALHQLRVAVRRLRSALWLFRPAARDGRFGEFDQQLRRFTRELGAARNIDVILLSLPLNDPARSQLEDDRRRLYAKIIRKLESRTFRLFVFDLFAWAHIGSWREGRKAKAKLLPFALKRLDRLWERIERRAGDLNRRSDEERHKLRIDTKKMRYALEFFKEPLADLGQARKKFAEAAEGVQDRLGNLNDLAARREVLFWSADTTVKARSLQLREAKRYLIRMKEVGPFWRTVRD
jgi:inorganic triphosphatase YgiF